MKGISESNVFRQDSANSHDSGIESDDNQEIRPIEKGKELPSYDITEKQQSNKSVYVRGVTFLSDNDCEEDLVPIRMASIPEEVYVRGNYLACSENSIVKKDKENEGWLYKVCVNSLRIESDEEADEIIEEEKFGDEVKKFNLFYGPGSAEIIKDKEERFRPVIRMKEIPGKTVSPDIS